RLVHHGAEVLEYAEAHLLALLGMELAGEDVPPGDARREFRAVWCRARHQGRVGRHRIVGMDEVHVRAVGDAGERRDGPGDPQRVPPHVRHLAVGRVTKADDPTREDAETANRPELLALL